MSYPLDVAMTLAAQNIQCLENYQSSLIDLPPSIENIYATASNELIPSLSSRFNHQPVGSVSQKAEEEMMRRKSSNAKHLPHVIQ